MNEKYFGLVLNFDSLSILLDILMRAGYEGDSNARLLYLDIVEDPDFEPFLTEKRRREGNSNLKKRTGTTFSGVKEHHIEDACKHEARMTNIFTGRTFCMDCKVELTSFWMSKNPFGEIENEFTKPRKCNGHCYNLKKEDDNWLCMNCGRVVGKVASGRLTADVALLEKCFQMEAHKKDDLQNT